MNTFCLACFSLHENSTNKYKNQSIKTYFITSRYDSRCIKTALYFLYCNNNNTYLLITKSLSYNEILI